MGKELPEYSWKDRIDWPKGFKPLDEPACGYQEEKCQGGKGVTEIVAGVSCDWSTRGHVTTILTSDWPGAGQPAGARPHPHALRVPQVEDRAGDRGSAVEDQPRVSAELPPAAPLRQQAEPRRITDVR